MLTLLKQTIKNKDAQIAAGSALYTAGVAATMFWATTPVEKPKPEAMEQDKQSSVINKKNIPHVGYV